MEGMEKVRILRNTQREGRMVLRQGSIIGNVLPILFFCETRMPKCPFRPRFNPFARSRRQCRPEPDFDVFGLTH